MQVPLLAFHPPILVQTLSQLMSWKKYIMFSSAQIASLTPHYGSALQVPPINPLSLLIWKQSLGGRGKEGCFLCVKGHSTVFDPALCAVNGTRIVWVMQCFSGGTWANKRTNALLIVICPLWTDTGLFCWVYRKIGITSPQELSILIEH